MSAFTYFPKNTESFANVESSGIYFCPLFSIRSSQYVYKSDVLRVVVTCSYSPRPVCSEHLNLPLLPLVCESSRLLSQNAGSVVVSYRSPFPKLHCQYTFSNILTNCIGIVDLLLHLYLDIKKAYYAFNKFHQHLHKKINAVTGT